MTVALTAAVLVLGALLAVEQWRARRTDQLLIELIAEVRALRRAAEK